MNKRPGPQLNVLQRLAIKAFGINKLPGFSNVQQAIVGGTVAWDGQNLQETITKGYAGNGTVYSIIKMIMDKVKEAPWAEYEVVDQTALIQYKAARKKFGTKDGPTFKELKALQGAALRPVKVPSKISMLLNNPNPDDTFQDIIEKMAMYKLSTGNTYLTARLLTMGPNTGMPQELHVMPSQWMQIVTDLNKFPFLSAIGYKLAYGENAVFTRAEMLHDKYPNPNFSTMGEHLIGLSPIQAGFRELSRDNSGKTRAVKSFDHGGPPVIISIDGGPNADGAFLQTQVDLMKARIAEYEGAYNSNKPAFSGYPAQVTQLGLSPIDLQLVEVEGYNTDALCNLWGVPSELLNRNAGKSMSGQSGSSKDAAEKALTIRCALPLLNSFRDQFNRKFANEWGGMRTVIDYDISVYKELEADRKDQATWLNTAWWIPAKMKFELMGLDVPEYLTDEDLEQIILPSGLQPLDMANAGNGLPDNQNPYKQTPTPTLNG